MRILESIFGLFLVALGGYVSWYVQVGSFGNGKDDPWYFPHLFFGSLGSIICGGYLLLAGILG